MPRGIPNRKMPVMSEVNTLSPLEVTLDEIRTLLETRRMEYQTSADRITEIIASMSVPTPRIGRPPKQR